MNELLHKQQCTNNIQKFTLEVSHLTNQHDIAYAFNNYFSFIIDKINSNNLDKMQQKEQLFYL